MIKRFGRICFLLFVVLVFIGTSCLTSFASVQQPSGKVGNGNNETPGEWLIGATPPNLNPDAPILLFVPGLNNVAQIFWEVDNSLYQAAYNAGYQTVFIQLHDAGGASADMWANGELLADKIREISAYYNGKPITIIAYSKGGVDTQTALTYYGVSHLVDRVITLSSPHHGSELANLAYSGGAGWLADLIGATGDGTYVMQTGYMQNFRQQTDQHPNAYLNNYYTLGGTDWGSMFSATWFGGMYLSFYGSNDGVVRVSSSRLPGGQEIAVGNWNHTNIRTGLTFPVFENYISSQSPYGVSPSKNVGMNEETLVNRWIDGGPLAKNQFENISITVENDVDEMIYTVLTADTLTKIFLVDSNNKRTTPKYETVKIDEGIFAGAYAHTFSVKQPKQGEWELQIRSKEDNAYLLVVDYETDEKLRIKQRTDLQLSQLQTTNQLVYEIESLSSDIDLNSIEATYVVKNSKTGSTYEIQATGTEALKQTLKFPEHDSVYNLTIDIKGKLKDGAEFTRTVIDSVYLP